MAQTPRCNKREGSPPSPPQHRRVHTHRAAGTTAPSSPNANLLHRAGQHRRTQQTPPLGYSLKITQ